jgi:hypothetical protein
MSHFVIFANFLLINNISFPIIKDISNQSSIWNTEKLPDQWKESIIVPVHKKAIKQTAIIIGEYHYYQLHTTFIEYSLLKAK